MIVDVHTHVWEPAHLGESFVRDARAASGNPHLEIAVDLDAHWAAMAPVDRAIVLGFRARHVGVLVPNEYVAAYVSRHQEKLIGFCSVDPHDEDAVEQLEHAVSGLGLRGLKVAPIYQNVHPSAAPLRDQSCRDVADRGQSGVRHPVRVRDRSEHGRPCGNGLHRARALPDVRRISALAHSRLSSPCRSASPGSRGERMSASIDTHAPKGNYLLETLCHAVSQG